MTHQVLLRLCAAPDHTLDARDAIALKHGYVALTAKLEELTRERNYLRDVVAMQANRITELQSAERPAE